MESPWVIIGSGTGSILRFGADFGEAAADRAGRFLL